MDVNSLLDDINKIVGQVNQNQQVVQDIASGKKKIAIVPGSGPSFVLPTSNAIAVGIPALPIIAILVGAFFLLGRKR